MFERLRRLFRIGRSEPRTGMSASDAGSIDPFGAPYRPELPDRMREVHAALRAAFELAQDSERRGEPKRVLAHLEAFDHLLRGYVAGESNEFHAYMSECLSGDFDRLMLLRALRARLRLLSHEVHDLVKPRGAERERPSRPALGRTLVEWGTTLRDGLSELERDLLPAYLPRAARN
jgi:hypothetical protein